MTPVELLLVGLAGAAAGLINALAGSGTLITFPTLLALGVPPVTANVSNTVGLVPGAVSGAIGWRHELVGQRRRLIRLGSASVLGGVTGAVLLLVLPSSTFDAVVPVLIVVGILLVAFQTRITARVRRDADGAGTGADRPWVWPGVAATGVYGGYFGAAQGILLMAVLGIGTRDSLHRNNAFKNVLAGLVNGVAAVIFIVVADVDWAIAGVIAVGSVLGAQIGVKVGRRLPAPALRAFIVLVGTIALVVFLLR